MDFAQYHDSFQRDGFAVVRRFLNGEALDQLHEQLQRYIRDVVPTVSATDAFYVDPQRPETLKQIQRMGVDPYFSDHRKEPRWNALAEALLGEPVEAKEPEWFAKPPGTEHPTPPHQDNFYFCLRPPSVATLWLALDPVDHENGCLRYVAGSHQRGIRPHDATQVVGFSQGITDYGADDEAREVAVQLEPGDLVAHHGETIHRADANQSSRQRRAFAMVMRGVSCRRDEDAWQRYLASLNRQHQQLGIDAR